MKAGYVLGLDFEKLQIVLRRTYALDPGFDIEEIVSEGLAFPLIRSVALGVQCGQVQEILFPLFRKELR